MSTPYGPQDEPGLYIENSFDWDVARLQQINVTSPEFKELLTNLYRRMNKVVMALNLKTTGYYTLTEFMNGELYFPDAATINTSPQPTFRNVFRLAVDFGALPAAGTKSVAHGLTITNRFRFTHIYATATDPVNLLYIPIPYASSVAADIIELNVDATNVNITVASNKSAYSTTFVVIEYIKY